MSRAKPPPFRTIFAPDGQVNWLAESRKTGEPKVKRIIVGRLEDDESGEKGVRGPSAKRRQATFEIPDNLAGLFPDLTHLYLWNIPGPLTIPALPPTLECLDIRGCEGLTALPKLPDSLDTLVLERCTGLRVDPSGALPVLKKLVDLSVRGSPTIDQGWLWTVVATASALRRLDASQCTRLTEVPREAANGVPTFGAALTDIRFDGCVQLRSIKAAWPAGLKRVGLRGASALGDLPTIPSTIDVLDLAHTVALKELPLAKPTIGGPWPRTLYLFGSAVGGFERDLFGRNADENVARQVRAHLESIGVKSPDGRAPIFDHEVKVIVLGDPRCGKTSLAKALVGLPFDSEEPSTHPISLWLTTLPFTPIGDTASENPTAILNIWDFGGQELYHNTHRRFLQLRAVYVLCDTLPSLPGADEAGDAREQREEASHAHGVQFRPRIEYWKEQVRSLVEPASRRGSPPMVLVTTKCEREGVVPLPGSLPFDASPADDEAAAKRRGQRLEDLRRRIGSGIAEVLGERRVREIGPDRHAVKLWIQELKRRNQGERDAHDRRVRERKDAGDEAPVRPFTPSTPFITREAFDRKMREHASIGSLDHEDPGLWLRRLHESGCVHALRRPWESPRPAGDGGDGLIDDVIVLDQAWALRAAYTLFDRDRCWRNLTGAGGRFTMDNVRRWAWDDDGYSEEHQRLFLSFMRVNGMCFELLPAEKTLDHRAIYVAIGALDERTGQEASLPPESEIACGRMGSALENAVSRDVMLHVLVQLGRRWRRRGALWRWGGRFESFRRTKEKQPWAEERTFVELDWRPHRPDSYWGVLSVRRFGPDATFVDAVTDQIALELRNAGVGDEAIATQFPASRLHAGERHVEGGQAPIDLHAPSVDEAIGVEVTISYKGQQGHKDIRPASRLPGDSIEKWPRLIAQRLRDAGLSVIDYRTEQGKPPHWGTDNKRDVSFRVSQGDIVLVILSQAYLQSPWCMQELAWVFERIEAEAARGVHQSRSMLLIAGLPGARPYDTGMGGEGQATMNNLIEWWPREAERIYDELANKPGAKIGEGLTRVRRQEEWQEYSEWLKVVTSAAKFDAFCKRLRQWPGDADLDVPPNDRTLLELVSSVAERITDDTVLLACSRRAHEDSLGLPDDSSDQRRAQERASTLLGQALAVRALKAVGARDFGTAVSEHARETRGATGQLAGFVAQWPQLRAAAKEGWDLVMNRSAG